MLNALRCRFYRLRFQAGRIVQTPRLRRWNQPMSENLTGLIERVTFHNPENGFAVLRVKVKGRKDLITVTGNTTSVSAGEHVEASGRWVIDRQHGQQFKADELKTTHPASAEGIEKYLASGAIQCQLTSPIACFRTSVQRQAIVTLHRHSISHISWKLMNFLEGKTAKSIEKFDVF